MFIIAKTHLKLVITFISNYVQEHKYGQRRIWIFAEGIIGIKVCKLYSTHPLDSYAASMPKKNPSPSVGTPSIIEPTSQLFVML